MAPVAVNITPFRSNKDLVKLRQWFYHQNDSAKKKLALEKVKVYSSRGKVPHGVNATSSIVAVEMMEGIVEPENLQHAYCSALTRLVNGLLDPFQQASVALPLSKLAKEIGLPSSFVELRHMATHEELPSLSHLKLVAGEAKQWLYDNYWAQIVESPAVVPEREDHLDHSDSTATIAPDLKAYKRIRKSNVDSVPSSKDGAIFNNYQALVKRLRDGLHKSAFRQTLYQELILNHLIYTDLRNREMSKRMKFKTLLKIYEPLFQELGPSFQADLLFAFVQYGSDYASYKFSAQEEAQAQAWVEHLTSQLINEEVPSTPGLKDPASLREAIKAQTSILPPSSPLRKEIETIVQETDNTAVTKNTPKRFAMPPSLDELIGPSKRQKLSESPTPQPTTAISGVSETPPAPYHVFSQKPSWTPHPFGFRPKGQ